MTANPSQIFISCDKKKMLANIIPPLLPHWASVHLLLNGAFAADLFALAQWLSGQLSRVGLTAHILHEIDFIKHFCHRRNWVVSILTKSTGYKLMSSIINPLRQRQNGRHFADDIFKCIFLNENVWIPIEISLKFVPKGPIDNIPALV